MRCLPLAAQSNRDRWSLIVAALLQLCATPTAADGPESTLIADLLRCTQGQVPTDTWQTPRMIDGHLKANGRSANHGRMARAVQTCAAPDQQAGRSKLTARQWWDAIEELERTTFGHRYQEIGGGYESWSGLSEAFVVAHTKDGTHPAATMLERELLLFSFAARPIEQHSKWRAIYRGYGRRIAGLRKLPWTWSFTPDSYLYARILNLPVELPPIRRQTEIELIDAIAPQVAEVLGERLQLLRTLVLAPATLADRVDELQKRAKGLRAIQEYMVVRHLPDDAVFSALLGPLRGRNTAPTRAVLVRGPRVEQADFAYPFRDRAGEPRRRVRGGAAIDAGGGDLLLSSTDQVEYRTWNGVGSPSFLSLPNWVPITPPGGAGDAQSSSAAGTGVASCGTVGIWLFPDREAVMWLAPACAD